jgi:hypothetical protein
VYMCVCVLSGCRLQAIFFKFLNLGFFCASFSFLSSTYYSPSIGIIIHGCVTLSVCVCVFVWRGLLVHYQLGCHLGSLNNMHACIHCTALIRLKDYRNKRVLNMSKHLFYSFSGKYIPPRPVPQ